MYGYRVSATANRSLPDIPIDSHRIQLESGDTLWENSEPNGDTSSELYATVEENKNVSQLLGEYHIRIVILIYWVLVYIKIVKCYLFTF